ncbi:MAG: folate-binding protein [Cyanobacteria bacterium P01_F01_bin.53]
MTNLPSVVFDRTHWGRIRLSGADRVRFLHNQTTNNIEALTPGQGCHTVFVTSTGRTIDLATAYALPDSLLVTVSPGMTKQLYDWMDRYIFFSDKVTLQDESDQTFMFTVLGEKADSVVLALGGSALDAASLEHEQFSHQTVALGGVECLLAVGSDLALPGYTLIGPKEAATTVWQALLDVGAQPGTSEQWDALRITQGRPMPTQELTDNDNPLEAGLWHSISFEKGCYIGQETIARLNTYKGVKKRLWGLKLDKNVAPGATISTAVLASDNAEDTRSEDTSTETDNSAEPKTPKVAKIGRLTSTVETETGIWGLGYLRTKAGGEGLRVSIDGVAAEAITLPFIRHEYYAVKK